MWTITSLFSKLLSFIFPPACFNCKKPNTTLCDECLTSSKKSLSSPYPFIVSLYSFKTPLIRKTIHAIKYFNRKDLIEPLAAQLANEIRYQNLPGTIVPIPMHPFRKIMRGYNQSEELAYTVAKILSRPYGKDTLRKTSFTKRQVKTTTKHQRINNQKNTFEVILPVGDGDFILIDDVTTTGATMLAARHALLSSGARTVTGVTVAH